jgi:hypothetical protein
VRLARTVVLIALTVSAISFAAPPCAVTKPPNQVFVPAPPYAATPGQAEFYFGSDDFWTTLPNDGVWETQHDHSTYDRNKIVWFSKDYWWLSGMEKDLAVDAKRLDGAAKAVHMTWATNAFLPERQESAMLSEIEFPATGCWEVTAHYQSHELKFVVWVMPYTASSN